jgi:hypothetical protein
MEGVAVLWPAPLQYVLFDMLCFGRHGVVNEKVQHF